MSGRVGTGDILIIRNQSPPFYVYLAEIFGLLLLRRVRLSNNAQASGLASDRYSTLIKPAD